MDIFYRIDDQHYFDGVQRLKFASKFTLTNNVRNLKTFNLTESIHLSRKQNASIKKYKESIKKLFRTLGRVRENHAGIRLSLLFQPFLSLGYQKLDDLPEPYLTPPEPSSLCSQWLPCSTRPEVDWEHPHVGLWCRDLPPWPEIFNGVQ